MGNVTSVTRNAPTTTTKGTWYYAVRAVAGSGRGALSNRSAIAVFNETVTGTTYKSYFTVYKNSAGTKYVNGFNQNAVLRYLEFLANHNASISGPLTANARWFNPNNSSWTAQEIPTYYGPFVIAVDSPSSSFSPGDSQWMSTGCMGSELTTYCE